MGRTPALRCALAAGVLGVALAIEPAHAQSAMSGMNVTKSCPTQASASGTATCTLKIENIDPDNALLVDSVTNEYPVPGGTVHQITTCNSDSDHDGDFALAASDSVDGAGPDYTECALVESISSCAGSSVTVVDKATVNAHGGFGGTLPLTGGPVHNAVTFLCSGPPTPGPHTAGHEFTKECDLGFEGQPAVCTIRIRNLDPDHGLQITQVQNEFPYPGGTVSGVTSCLADTDMDGSFLLAASDGTPGGSDTTECEVEETITQPCIGEAIAVYDRASMSGYDVGTNGPQSGSAAAGAVIICDDCGNDVVDSGEQCDDGEGTNGGESSCCAANCQYKANGNASCDGNLCTRPDTCTNGVCTPGSCATGSCTFCGGTCTSSGGCHCVP